MSIWESITHYNADFVPYGSEHLIAVLITSLIGVVTIVFAKRQNAKLQDRIFKGLCLVITGSVIFWAFAEVLYGRFEAEKDIPFIFCNFIATVLPLYAFSKDKTMFNIIYYLVVVGAIQAIITPSLKFNFPHYESLKFWSVHAGLLIVVFYSIFVFKYRPTFRGMIKTYISLQIYVCALVLINYVFDWNYLYLKQKPPVTTLLDFLGDWPYYVIAMDLLLIPYFLLIYAPFHTWSKSRSKT